MLTKKEERTKKVLDKRRILKIKQIKRDKHYIFTTCSHNKLIFEVCVITGKPHKQHHKNIKSLWTISRSNLKYNPLADLNIREEDLRCKGVKKIYTYLFTPELYKTLRTLDARQFLKLNK